MKNESQFRGERNDQAGFSLIEMVVALIVLLIAVMGVFAAFTYATRTNHGNSQRSQGVSVFQREIELLRSAKFTPAVTSNTTVHQHTLPVCPIADSGSRDITGGTKEAEYRCGIDGTVYRVNTSIDDNPATAAIDVNAATNMKQITLEVTPLGADGAWITASRIRMVFRRVRAN
jgi:prepilin-type N-terminal cleavage/methylation domain-containing protein